MEWLSVQGANISPHKCDLVKWEDCEPHEVIDWVTGEKKMSSRFCFSIGTLIWDSKEPWFYFESCGLRYFEHRIDGLEEFILDFCKMMEKELLEE